MTETDEIKLIRELREGLPGAREESRSAARAALLRRIDDEENPVPSRWQPRTWLAPRGRRRTAAAVAALAFVAIAVSTLLPSGGREGVQSAAAEILRHEADIAGSLSPTFPVPGQRLFAQSKGAHLVISFREGPRVAAQIERRLKQHPNAGVKPPIWWAYVPVERKMWLNSKGSGRIREIDGAPRFLSERQRAAWIAAGSPPLPRAGHVSNKRFEPHGLSGLYFSRLSQLPTDPHELRRWIEAHNVPGGLSTAGTTSTGLPTVTSGHAKTFGAIGFLLGESFAPPALRAALFEAASELPGVRLLGHVSDPVGRKGVGIAYTDRQHGERLELIFDPATSRLLGERWVVTSPKRSGIAVPAGTVVGYEARLTARSVR